MASEPPVRLAVVLDDIAVPPDPFEGYARLNSWVVPGNVYTMPVQAYDAGPPSSQAARDIQRDVRLGLMCADEARSRLTAGLI